MTALAPAAPVVALETDTPKRSWETLCNIAREARGATDEGRFLIGDIALEIATEYSGRDVKEFANEIGISSSSAYEYRDMSAFYDIPHRRKIAQDYPTVTYSHLRVARRAGSLDAALSLLDEANAGAWGVDKMAVEWKKRGGKTVAQKLLDAIVPTETLAALLGGYEGARVRIVIYEV